MVGPVSRASFQGCLWRVGSGISCILSGLLVASGYESGADPDEAGLMQVPRRLQESMPAVKEDTLLAKTPILMTHDSATGYFGADGLLTKVQECGFSGQLSCGARAFDLRMIWMNDAAHFHHMPTQDGMIVPTTITGDQTLENTIGEFISFADQNPDELLILYMSHCAMAQKLNMATEPLPCDNPNFQKTYDAHNLLVLNQAGVDLKTLTFAEAKQKAKEKSGKAIIVVTDNFVDENWDDNVKCAGTASSCESEFDGPWNNYITNYLNGDHNDAKMQILQAHWQGVAIEAKNRALNQRVADKNGPIMQKLDKVNMLQINFIGDGGKEIAQELGVKVDTCDCR